MNIIVGISGGIAAYKAPQLVRLLKDAGHDVRCAATSHALEFVTKTTLQTVSGHSLYCDLFDSGNEFSTEHIALKDWCDAVIVAPATANIIGKMACGIADDALSTLLLSTSGKPLFVCPAMNCEMWRNPALQRNITLLRQAGAIIVGPDEGHLACGTDGIGRMSRPDAIVAAFNAHNSRNKPLHGKRVLITAGPTYERIDPVRFIGNFSSGKMGLALADSLLAAGAEVDLVLGPVGNIAVPSSPLLHRHDVESARQMFDAATSAFSHCDAAILAAAVADYRPADCAAEKIKKQGDDNLTLTLVQNPDILATLGSNKKEGQTLIGFALETTNEMANAQKKLEKKNLDYIVLNSLRDAGAGFATDTNKVTILSRDGLTWVSDLLSKREIAQQIIERTLYPQKKSSS